MVGRTFLSAIGGVGEALVASRREIDEFTGGYKPLPYRKGRAGVPPAGGRRR